LQPNDGQEFLNLLKTLEKSGDVRLFRYSFIIDFDSRHQRRDRKYAIRKECSQPTKWLLWNCDLALSMFRGKVIGSLNLSLTSMKCRLKNLGNSKTTKFNRPTFRVEF
jgi:hypothetical protein